MFQEEAFLPGSLSHLQGQLHQAARPALSGPGAHLPPLPPPHPALPLPPSSARPFAGV